MIKRYKINLILILFCSILLVISGCKPQLNEGDVNVTISAEFDAGWSQEYWELDFGTVNRCDVLENPNDNNIHGLELINEGLVPVNIDLKYTDNLFDHPDSEWQFKTLCKAINPNTGNVYNFSGDCWDGPEGIQNNYIEVPATDTNVVSCLNYRATGALTDPGVKIFVKLNISCSEPTGPKTGIIAVTLERADNAIDCGGDSGYDPGPPEGP